MERLYLWPAHPAASLLALWLFSQLFFYAARVPMHRAFSSAGRVLAGALRLVAKWCRGQSANIAKRDHEMIVEMGKGDAEAKIAKEFRRIEGTFVKELRRYPDLHRKLDDVAGRIEADY